MNQEIKLKLEQAAEKYEIELYDILLEEPCQERIHFKAGAQNILENPSEYGLEYSTQTFKDALAAASQHAMENTLLKSQLAKYRELLKQLQELHSDHEFTCILIEEALKQEVNND